MSPTATNKNALPMGIENMGSHLVMFYRFTNNCRLRLTRTIMPDLNTFSICADGLRLEAMLEFGSQFKDLCEGVYGTATEILHILNNASAQLFDEPGWDGSNIKDDGQDDGRARLQKKKLRKAVSIYWDNCSFRSLSAYASLVVSLRKKGQGAMFLVSVLMEIIGRLRDYRCQQNFFVSSLERFDRSVCPPIVNHSKSSERLLSAFSETRYHSLPAIPSESLREIERIEERLKKSPIDGGSPEILRHSILFLGFMRKIGAFKKECVNHRRETAFYPDEDFEEAVEADFSDLDDGVAEMAFHLVETWDGADLELLGCI